MKNIIEKKENTTPVILNSFQDLPRVQRSRNPLKARLAKGGKFGIKPKK